MFIVKWALKDNIKREADKGKYRGLHGKAKIPAGCCFFFFTVLRKCIRERTVELTGHSGRV